MKTAELLDRTPKDLVQLEEELARDLWKTRFGNYTNQLDDTAKIRRLRRDIARVKTIYTQKQNAAPKGVVETVVAAVASTIAKVTKKTKSAPKAAVKKTKKAKG